MSVQSTANNILSISGQLSGGGDGQAAIDSSRAAKDALAARARYIAGREFMIKLRGDNDQIALEQLQSLRGDGAKELSKGA
jgi:hypothetical protein